MKDQTVYLFDQDQHLSSVVDPNGNETKYLYDERERLIKIVDEVGLATVFSYNEAGKVSKISDPANRETLLSYDQSGNLISVSDPDNSTRTWKYDSKHHMVGETDQRGKSEQTFYDFAGRVYQGVRKDGSVNKINPVQVEGLYRPEATTNITSPPSAHRLSEEIFSSFASGNGNVEVSQLDQAGQVISTFDEEGSSLSSVERNEDNLITSTVDGKGVKTEYTYDEQGNVLTIKDSLTLANSTGGDALIINGAATSSEPPLALSATDNVESLLEDSGYETTVAEDIPEDISEYEQIWDLRVDNNTALSVLLQKLKMIP
jgi:YD repeat-containing protein